MTAEPIVFRSRWALGDTVCLSAAIRDLERAHPGRYRISLTGSYPSYWKHCPYVHKVDPALRAPVVEVEYKEGAELSHAGQYRQHFLTWFHRALGRRLRVEIPVTAPKGEIHLDPALGRPIAHRYWVVMAGGKTDMTAKWWSFARYQEVVDRLAARGVACVQAGANFRIHVHAKLNNCLSRVGGTDDVADLFNLIKHSEGVICGITSGMHIAAAFDKPCVVLAGGREEPTWEAYTNHGQFPPSAGPVKVPHVFLHTIGLLDCCAQVGCWKSRTVPIEAADSASVRGRDRLCKDPVRGPDQALPRCMTMIEVRHVVEAAMSYYEQGVIPPIDAAAPAPAPAPPPPAVATHNPIPAEAAAGAGAAAEPAAFRVLDHPVLGGKVTIFLLCYGDHADLARRCFDSIFKTVPAGRMDVRVGLNQPGPATMAYFEGLERGGRVAKLYLDQGDRRKYPAMRQMFRDPDLPVRTPYLVWFDDDAVAVDPLWLPKLAETIAANHRHGARLYGAPFVHDLALYAKGGHRPDHWFRAASWWRDRPLQLRGQPGRTAANGSCIPFVSGWFWAMAAEMIQAADVPDARLNHNGGDCTLGAQVYQAGYKIKAFNDSPPKAQVWCPSREAGGRRGFHESFPWAAPALTPA